MASRGGLMVAGTDGADYEYRQRVAAPHRMSLQGKKRVKFCICYHIVLSIFMVTKLSPDFLDRIDVFWLEVEELEVPKPLWWEYVWMTSVFTMYFALSAILNNSIREMQKYMIAIMLTGVIPVCYCFAYYFRDFWEYINLDEKTDIKETDIFIWRGMPYAVLWYGFSAVAIQLHGFTLYFAYKCIRAWRMRSAIKKSQ